MRPLMLDLHDNRRPVTGPNMMLLILGLTITLALAVYASKTFSHVDQLESQQSAIERDSRRTAELPPSPMDEQQLHDEIKGANEVLARVSLPWERLFKDIESSPRDNIALLALKPDAVKRVITITGEAKSLEDMLNYIRLLQERGSLTHVFLQSHHIELKSAQHPVHFVVAASWEGAL